MEFNEVDDYFDKIFALKEIDTKSEIFEDLQSKIENLVDVYFKEIKLDEKSRKEDYLSQSYCVIFERLKSIAEKYNVKSEESDIVNKFSADFLKLKKQNESVKICLDNIEKIKYQFISLKEEMKKYIYSYIKDKIYLLKILDADLYGNEINDLDSVKYWLSFLDNLPEISRVYSDINSLIMDLNDSKQTMTLNECYKDKAYIANIEKLISHDKEKFEYLYHGTQCVEDAESILKSGLLMASSDLQTTTYKELTLDQILLYSRGFDNAVGSSIVVIKKPIKENIVKRFFNKDNNYKFCQSGLGGFSEPKYYVPEQYIVGYIDKVNHKVVFGDILANEKGAV